MKYSDQDNRVRGPATRERYREEMRAKRAAEGKKPEPKPESSAGEPQLYRSHADEQSLGQVLGDALTKAEATIAAAAAAPSGGDAGGGSDTGGAPA